MNRVLNGFLVVVMAFCTMSSRGSLTTTEGVRKRCLKDVGKLVDAIAEMEQDYLKKEEIGTQLKFKAPFASVEQLCDDKDVKCFFYEKALSETLSVKKMEQPFKFRYWLMRSLVDSVRLFSGNNSFTHSVDFVLLGEKNPVLEHFLTRSPSAESCNKFSEGVLLLGLQKFGFGINAS